MVDCLTVHRSSHRQALVTLARATSIEGLFDVTREGHASLHSLANVPCPAVNTLSSASLDRGRYLRLTLANLATGRNDIIGLVQEIRELVSAQRPAF